jgi:predicted nucleotide-binding protein
MATLDEIKDLLGNAGYRIAEEKRLPNDKGFQLRIYGGQIVNIFDNGTCQVQGRDQEAIKAVLADAMRQGGAGTASRRSTANIFVVYGHDQLARNQLDAMLRRWRLEPLFLDQLPSEGQTIIEKLERYRQQASFAVILATPDDEGLEPHMRMRGHSGRDKMWS